MKTGLAIVALALTLCACQQAATSPTRPVQSAPVAASEPGVGRFAIVQNAQSEPHTIMLDTVTGRTWTPVVAQNGAPAWVQMYRPPADQNSN